MITQRLISACHFCGGISHYCAFSGMGQITTMKRLQGLLEIINSSPEQIMEG